MVRKLRVDVRLATQVLLLQVVVVTLTLGIAGGLLAFLSHNRIAAEYETRSFGRGTCDRLRTRRPCRCRALQRCPVDAEPSAH
jgi:hypothetical protein